MARDLDKASPHLSVFSQNKIKQILKNNILLFLFFTLASEVFSYVIYQFRWELRYILTLNKTVVLICK